MHQHIRSAPRSSSAASNPSTNPERTNNRREQPPQRTRSSVDLASYTERGAGTDAGNGSQKGQGAGPSAGAAGSGQDKELNKLNQIIQVGGEETLGRSEERWVTVYPNADSSF